MKSEMLIRKRRPTRNIVLFERAEPDFLTLAEPVSTLINKKARISEVVHCLDCAREIMNSV